jgi:hypothetical protein
MSNDPKSNDFIRACTLQATRFCNMQPPQHEAATILLNIASAAIRSPQETAPIHHYVSELREALIEGYGQPWELADLPNTKQEEAISAWLWFQDATGARLDGNTTAKTLTGAVTEMRLGGEGWRQRMRDALQQDLNRKFCKGEEDGPTFSSYE